MRKRHNKLTVAICFSLLIAVSMVFVPFTDAVWAEDGDGEAPDKLYYMLRNQSDSMDADSEDDSEEPEEGTHVHADPATFEKNFDLSWEQKKQTIQEIEKIVSENTTSDMCDLEKYYTLAIAGNKRVQYDWDFWAGRYFFEYYSHQWDSYGALFEKSVCAGIAIFYSHLCHAADLPCWFIRMDPEVLDHTICYIPDINDNAYYIDVTENLFFMSEDANPFQPMDKAFSHITKDCTDNTFNNLNEDGETLETLGIKACYDLPYEDWFREYAKHENTTKNFPTEYVEKGSGEAGKHYKTYHDYRSNFVDETDVWFLDDFYREPAAIKEKIINKDFDDQLLNVSGVRKNYDCASQDELNEIISQDLSDNKISVEFFPTYRDGEVVAESAGLEANADYEIACTDFNADDKTAEITVKAKDESDYSGSYKISVKLNSAVVAEAPVSIKGLKYNGRPQTLIKEGEAEGGVMLYALGTEDEPTEEFTTDLPMATDAGKYYVWYKAAGTDGHEDSDAVCMEPVASIAPITVTMTLDNDLEVMVGETVTITPKLDNPKIPVKYTFDCVEEDIATVDDKGVVTGLSRGVTTIYVEAHLKEESPNYEIDGYDAVVVEVKEPFDISETKIRFAKSSLTYNGKVQKPTITTVKGWKLKLGRDYTVKWSNEKSTNAGTYKVIVTGKGDYTGSTDATYTIRKAANPMTLKPKNVTVKYSELKKKAKPVKRTDAFTTSKAKGKRSYKLVSAKKGKKSFRKKFKVDSKTGKITVKRGLKKGTYNVKVKVKASGTANYKASAWKTVTFKVKVK